ncbi:DNA/RNA helicase, superfamily II, SNF2 family [Brachybacterium faecium DSM 4810]|uniref:DNA/RNA helicase, superfamily II, SNF2 family n=1 Tax=Brachybacterium faecium (strain ATCC 43885 / DSM 4810 / JCM 11609 / LMG 19847 / NBRC 14762 / NCIMB 9860 / 6-10) TaxID=446465 RepID=C7MHJ1_BRAFD|nr:SNF2-related protein [Brachybacterium faecium]ACU84400.1 DNA/RNA helicase, superfamily II, SNF2 family [Brachybacterium faecium DSM 4810]
MTAFLTDYQSKYFAYELQRSYANDHVGKLAGLLFDAQVEPKPHQIDAALFALQTPFLPGVILADEVGLGKTIEAGIVISQYWAERKRRILIIAPSSLRQQWKQELYEKFLIPSTILDAKSKDSLLPKTDTRAAEVLVCSYEFAHRHETSLLKSWDLVVADEAHRLRSYWNGKAKMAEAVSHVARSAHKTVLLTATPLQNKLEELYGLVSIFDPDYFYSLDAFRERYIKSRDLTGDDDLVERVATISKRTLRKDANKYIRFTKRMPLTVEFTPSPDEVRLYDLVNDYLQRDELFAFAGSQRHLSALIIRKRLGSSTYAVASTLENIANRLADEVAAGKLRDNRGGLFLADFEAGDELEEEIVEEAEETTAQTSSAQLDAETLKRMRAEVDELREYAALARSITVNQKAVKLNEALDMGFERLRELGAAEKAIIFTDSTKTQEYIARTLADAGRGEGIVLFNGSNTSPEQTAIYQAWLTANKDGDLITGIPAVDRRKALVDYFREQGTIMIATEAAAEGINLQFCSMLVNYDLPWNPQRVEQRIGRVHRFGQKHNVVVVNFSNKGNIAEQRILELLTNKFQLFSSVFGASDEVLGAIEDGLDFEKTISDILTRCRTADELDSAFKELEAQYAGEISREMASAKAKVFDNLDPHVQDRLKAYDTQSGEVLNRFERLLLAVTRHELDEHATFEGDGRTFVLNPSPVQDAPTGRYFFKSQPLENAHQYRYASPLAQHVVETAKTHDTPARELTFSLGQSERVSSAIRALEGTRGELTVSVATFRMRARDEDVSESYMLAGAMTDDGRWLDEEYVADILDLACVDVGTRPVAIDEGRFTPHLDTRRAELEKEVQGRNSRYYDQQEELLYRNQQDRKAEHEGKIREYRAKEKEARKLARQADDPMEQLRLKKEARKWEQRAEEADEDFRDTRKKLRAEADKYLELIEQSLQGTQETENLFTIRWQLSE